VGSGITLSPDGDVFTTGVSTFIGNIHLDTDVGGENNRLLVGSNSTRNIGGSAAVGYFQIEGTSGNSSSMSLINNQNATNSPVIRFGKTRGTSTGAVTTVADGDSLGRIVFAGADGTDLENSTAVIEAKVNGTVAGNQIPTDLVFETSPSNSANRLERFRITSAGKVGIKTDNPRGQLHICQGGSGFNYGTTGHLVIENDNDSTIQLLAPSTHGGNIHFGDESNGMVGRIGYAHTDNSMRFTTGNVEKMRLDSSGLLLVNIDTPRYNDLLQVEGTGGESVIAVVRNSNNGSGAGLFLGKSRTNSVGGNTIVQDDDKLGAISFAGADGTNLATVGAQITGEVDGTPGENDMPGRLVFKTTADGASSTSERMRIDSGGRMGVGLEPHTSDVATNISPGLIQTDGNIDLRYSGTNNDPAGARYVNFINTDTTLVAGQPLGGLHWIGNDSENANTINAAILVDCAGNSGTDAHLLFKTSGSQRIRIKNNGDLVSSSGSTSRIAFGSGDGTLYSGMGYYAGGNQDVGLSLYATTNAGVAFVEHFRMEHNGTLKATDTSIGSLSDARLKKDIADYSYDISKFKQFKPKSFNWINPEVHGDKSNVKGFLAQDIEVIDSDWVEDSWISKDDPDFALISNTTDINGAGETVGVSKMSKFGYKDAMYISVIQQLIDRIETLENANEG
jgi:hypothetical protein